MFKNALRFVVILFYLGVNSVFGANEREESILILMDFYQRLQSIQFQESLDSTDKQINPELEIEIFKAKNRDEKKVFSFLKDLHSLIYENEFSVQGQRSPEFLSLRSSLQNFASHNQSNVIHEKIYQKMLANPRPLRLSIRAALIGYFAFSLYNLIPIFESILNSPSGDELFFGKTTMHGLLWVFLATAFLATALEQEKFKKQVSIDLQFLESKAKLSIDLFQTKKQTKKEMKLIKSIENRLEIPHLDQILAKVIGYRLVAFPCYNEFDECVICYNQMVGVKNMISTVCGHKFHKECFNRLVQFFDRCPFSCDGSLKYAVSEEFFEELKDGLMTSQKHSLSKLNLVIAER